MRRSGLQRFDGCLQGNPRIRFGKNCKFRPPEEVGTTGMSGRQQHPQVWEATDRLLPQLGSAYAVVQGDIGEKDIYSVSGMKQRQCLC